MKKFLVIMLSLAMALTMFTACGQKEETAQDGRTRTGLISYLACDTAEEDNYIYTYYDNLDTALLALKAGKIDEIAEIPRSTVEYIVNRDDELVLDEPITSPGTIDLTMGTLKENEEVYNIFNDAIIELKDNGTLEKLQADYIDAYLTEDAEPASIEMPVISGAKTIKVAVTGDFPPTDFVATDGSPAGYNIALLAEISKIANVNIEIVQMSSASRFVALSEGTVDIAFCNRGVIYNYDGEDVPFNPDCLDEMMFTEAYYSNPIAEIELKK